MTMHLPDDLQSFVRAQVESGRFASEEEAISAGVRLLRERERNDENTTLDGIRRGIDEMKAGLARPAEEVFAEIRREFNLPVER